MESPSGNVGLILGLFYLPIKLQHIQLLGWSTGALVLLGMLIGDN